MDLVLCLAGCHTSARILQEYSLKQELPLYPSSARTQPGLYLCVCKMASRLGVLMGFAGCLFCSPPRNTTAGARRRPTALQGGGRQKGGRQTLAEGTLQGDIDCEKEKWQTQTRRGCGAYTAPCSKGKDFSFPCQPSALSCLQNQHPHPDTLSTLPTAVAFPSLSPSLPRKMTPTWACLMSPSESCGRREGTGEQGKGAQGSDCELYP